MRKTRLEHLGLLKMTALYVLLIAMTMFAPERDGDPEDNFWLVEGDSGDAATPGRRR